MTYELKGRFGDSLLTYSHAEWLAYKYGLRVLFNPFPYADRLALIHSIVTEKDPCVIREKKRNRVYCVPYFSDFACENEFFSTHYFLVDWSDLLFKQRMKKRISPIEEIQLVQPKKDILSIAVHIRTTDTYDPEENKMCFREKFPPITFYSNALTSIAKLVNFMPMYVYVFTDHSNPSSLVDTLKKLITIDGITFDCDREVGRHDDNLLRDFFSIAQFPILVRGESNFSYIAARIGKPFLEIFSRKVIFEENRAVVKEIGANVFLSNIEASNLESRMPFNEKVFNLFKDRNSLEKVFNTDSVTLIFKEN